MWTDHPRCTAHSKRTGLPCAQPAAAGRKVCRYHGGKSLRGLASPTWKDGKYSTVLPLGMVEAYERARSDPELIALRDELAVVDARLTALLGDITTGATADLWQDLRVAWAKLEAAQRAQDTAAAATQLGLLRTLIQQGAAAGSAWAEVYDAMALRRSLADTERKRLEAMQATVTVDRVLGLVTALGESVKKHVHDRAALVAITEDIATLLRGNPEVARAAG
jgi:hypothetical protein